MNKRFTLKIDSEWWTIGDNTVEVNKYGYRPRESFEDDEDYFRSLRQQLTEKEVVDLLNEFHEKHQQTIKTLQKHYDENEYDLTGIKETIKEIADELNIQLK